MTVWTRDRVAALVDHTLLKPEATVDDVAALVTEATELGVYSVCVSPSMVGAASARCPAGLLVAAVAGFPSGKHTSVVKAYEAAAAVDAGAAEIDMVIDVGAALSGDIAAVHDDIATVRAAAGDAVLKVIIESAACRRPAPRRPHPARAASLRAHLAADAGADFVKTSTGFHPAGGASLPAVALMAQTVGEHLGVKASGGIRTAADALALLDAGATRLGLSGTRAVLDGLG